MNRASPFDMSLKMWSDDIPMEPIVRSMGLVAKHLHKRGEPINRPKYPSRRPATHHYALVAQARSSDERDVSTWLARTLRLINGQPALVGMIQAGTVEIMPWIGIMIHDPVPAPLHFDADLLEATRRLGAKILVEDYNREDERGLVPAKTWFK